MEDASELSLGQRIRRFRLAAGITVKAAAETAGVSVTTWRCWEQGRKTPLLTRGSAIADVLGIPVRALFAPEGYEAVTDLALRPETVARVRRGGLPVAIEVAAALACDLPAAILAACSRRYPDPSQLRVTRRRSRAEVLAGIAAAQEARAKARAARVASQGGCEAGPLFAET